jgi:D-ribose pyranase
MAKKRILNERLAGIVASMRHGEMLFIGDAGSGTSAKALCPLSPDVEYLDLSVVTGSPSFEDVVSTLVEVGDFEGAIITEDMPAANETHFKLLVDFFGKDNVHQIPYIPDYYNLRNKCKAMVQTGDYGIHAQAVIIAGYPSANIPVNMLIGKGE